MKKLYLLAMGMLFFPIAVLSQAEIQNPNPGNGYFWRLRGNTNTDTSLNFVGTTDNTGLTFRTNNIRRMTIDPNGRVGIGTVLPSVPGTLEAVNLGNSNPIFISTNYGNPNEFWFRRAQGTISAPTIIGSAGALGRIDGRGYDGTAFQLSSRIELAVDSNSSSGNMPGRISFYTNPSNFVGVPTERMRINRNGLVSINLTTAANAYLDINGDIALRQATLTLSNGSNNNVAVSPFPSGHSYYRIAGPTAPFAVTGLSATPGNTNGRLLILQNTTTQPMTLEDQSPSSAVNNRIMTGGGNLTIGDSGTVTLLYSAANNRWQVQSFTNGVLANGTFGDDWRTLGNAGTVDGVNFIGTTDSVPLNIRVDNLPAGRIDPRGNIYLGQGAGNTSAVPYSNIGIGRGALQNADVRSNIVAIGDSALHNNGVVSFWPLGVRNTAIGSKALFANTSGSYNTAIGFHALFSNTNSSNNTAVGSDAMNDNISGSDNTAVGANAIFSNTSGSDNTAVGANAMRSNTSGLENTVMGAFSLDYNTTGDLNTAVGFQAGAGSLNVNFNQCTFIGAESYPTVNRTNVTMLGYGITNAQCTGSNQVLLGNTAVTQIRAQVTGITAYSDARFKSNIIEDVKGLDFIMKLRPVSYNQNPEILHQIWGTPDSLWKNTDHSDIKQQRFVGLIAQEVEQAMKASGYDHFPGIDVPRNETEVYSMRYGDFIIPLIKAVQEQQKQYEKQQLLIETLQNHIDYLQRQNAELLLLVKQ